MPNDFTEKDNLDSSKIDDKKVKKKYLKLLKEDQKKYLLSQI